MIQRKSSEHSTTYPTVAECTSNDGPKTKVGRDKDDTPAAQPIVDSIIQLATSLYDFHHKPMPMLNPDHLIKELDEVTQACTRYA